MLTSNLGYNTLRSAFTMLELIFVIVVVGILSYMVASVLTQIFEHSWLEKFHMSRIVLRLIHFIILKKRDGVAIFTPSISFMATFFKRLHVRYTKENLPKMHNSYHFSRKALQIVSLNCGATSNTLA